MARYLLIFAVILGCCLPARAQEEPEPFVEVTEASLTAMERGMSFLLKRQNRDGGFGVDHGRPSDIACSALIGLVLLSAGNTPEKGIHAETLSNILHFVLRKVRTRPRVDITGETTTQVQYKIGRHAHSFFAALFLSQIAGEAGPLAAEALEALEEMVGVIIRAQVGDGSWGSTSWAPQLGTVMGWLSLRGANTVGLDIEASADRTADLLVQQLSAEQQHWMHDLYKNSTGVRVLYEMGRGDMPAARKGFQRILSLVTTDNTAFTQAGGEEFLSFHLITEVMLNKGGEDWRAWYGTVRDKLIAVQNRDGSWTGHHCITSRTFCTACAMLVLQAPYRYLPISNL